MLLKNNKLTLKVLWWVSFLIVLYHLMVRSFGRRDWLTPSEWGGTGNLDADTWYEHSSQQVIT